VGNEWRTATRTIASFGLGDALDIAKLSILEEDLQLMTLINESSNRRGTSPRPPSEPQGERSGTLTGELMV
jgi:hypothetical protein